MAKGIRNIEAWEAALIKAMLAAGGMTKDQIVSYFTRPDRTVNPFRLAEIEKGESHSDVEAATPGQVAVYLRTFRSPGEARQRFFEENPLHPVNLRTLFRLKDGTTDILHIEETDRVECKESLHFKQLADYARVIVSFANARGGFLLFGVRDGDKAITGIHSGKLTGYDPAKLNQHLSAHFSPVPVCEKTEMVISGKTVGIIYVRPAAHKPIICIRDERDVLREADIYYRYPGETRRIKYAELVGILDERSRGTEHQWADVLRRVEAAGVENVAILDTITGEVSGHSGKFLIDEKLIPKLKFVAEGHFSEREGAPALRLVGDLETISVTGVHDAKVIVRKERLTDGDLLREFVDQATVENPRLYAGHLAHSAKLWLPIYFFMRQARIDEAGAIKLLSEGPNSKRSHLGAVIRRVRDRSRPSMSRQITAAAAEPERSKLIDMTLGLPETTEQCERLIKAAMTLQPGEIHPDHLLPLLGHCLDRFHEGFGTPLTYAIAYIDIVWHEQLVGATVASAPESA
ncbi:putative transcriptional regulator [Paramagnetospirillum caucaseum]|uniref:Putative transcriptional regulator n=1 Tax=Paramagnetospirillum caucaseum TaxID=1244869 RepID=M2Y4G1_9PROT|nr:ATP-binding protein [Paramagnetospirillum caucaseum]EME67981.1 putative transcriptional regulator [Paramagnetospirillum caucaseum]